VNNCSLCEKLIGDSNMKDMSSMSSDSGAWKMAIDSHHNVLNEIWFLNHLLNIKLVMPLKIIIATNELRNLRMEKGFHHALILYIARNST